MIRVSPPGFSGPDRALRGADRRPIRASSPVRCCPRRDSGLSDRECARRPRCPTTTHPSHLHCSALRYMMARLRPGVTAGRSGRRRQCTVSGRADGTNGRIVPRTRNSLCRRTRRPLGTIPRRPRVEVPPRGRSPCKIVSPRYAAGSWVRDYAGFWSSRDRRARFTFYVHEFVLRNPVGASSYSAESGDCVQVASAPDRVLVRDSKHPHGPALAVPAAWRALHRYRPPARRSWSPGTRCWPSTGRCSPKQMTSSSFSMASRSSSS